MARVIVVNTLGPQGPPGPQGPAGSGSIDTGSFATTGSNSFIGNQIVSGSLIVTGSVIVSGSNTFTNIGPAVFSGSTAISGSLTANGYNVVTTNQTSSLNVSSASYAATSSFLNTLNQDLTFNGNLTLNGTASISTLVINQTQYSSGSNQLGDAANDTQTLYGSVIIPTGSLVVTGSTIISSSAATQLQVGSNLLFVSSSGRVGIGTNTPTNTLDVIGIARVSGSIILESPGITSYYFPQYTDVYGSNYSFNTHGSNYIRFWAQDTGYLTFWTATTEKIRLFNNGNLLLQNGGTFTDAGYRLDVSGSGRFTNGLTITGSVTASGNIVAASYLGDPNVQFGLNPSSGANTYIRLENTGLVPNGILFNTNNTSNSFKFKHDTNYTFTLGYQNTSAAWFGSNASLVTVNASAQVQIDSTTKGFLPPRTNTTASITSPAQGLITYLTGSTNEGLYYYNSGSQTGWHKTLTNTGSQSITGSLSVSGSITQNGVSLQALSIAYAIALG